MAEKCEERREFRYRNVTLFKDETLGTGSYGLVCKARCDQLVCAAKIMHNALFQLSDPSTNHLLTKFRQECLLNSAAKHPNIVQYIHTYIDPSTNLPVLLMELCDESLTRYLEQKSNKPTPYHLELDFSNDIAQALSYLHSNAVIHRDLTSNNVLLIAGSRAKVTDFGMSKLVSVSPRFTPLSLCPGNSLYMSPEALRQPPKYSTKLDVFSWGVLAIQIMTRLFPNPGPEFNTVEESDGRIIHEVIPEQKRRQSHIDLIDPQHPLLHLAVKCLNYSEKGRPTADDLCIQMAELCQSSRYVQSKEKQQEISPKEAVENSPLENPPRNKERKQSLDETKHRPEVEKLQSELQKMSRELSAKDKEIRSVNARIARLRGELDVSERHAEASHQTLAQRDETIVTLQENIEQQQHIISTLRAKLDESDDAFPPSPEATGPLESPKIPNGPSIPLQSRESMHTISNSPLVPARSRQSFLDSPSTPNSGKQSLLPNTSTAQSVQNLPSGPPVPPRSKQSLTPAIREEEEGEDKDNRSHTMPGRTRKRELSMTSIEATKQLPQRGDSILALAAQQARDHVKDKIMRLAFLKVEKAPEKMARGSATTHTNTAYFSCFSSNKIHFYQYLMGKHKWGTLPKCPYVNCGLAVVNGFVTTVGGAKTVGHDQPTNTLLTLASDGSKKKWIEVIQPMPTARQEMAVINTEHFIVVIGGRGVGGDRLNTVEVYRHESKQWHIGGVLPLPLTRPTATMIGDDIFIGSGSPAQGSVSKDIYTSTISRLLSPYYAFPAMNPRSSGGKQHSAWRKLASVPADHYTLCALSNRLVAVGGVEMSHCNSSAVRKYDPDKDDWEIVGHANHSRCLSLATHLGLDTMVIVGGLGGGGRDQGITNQVEVAKVSYA